MTNLFGFPVVLTKSEEPQPPWYMTEIKPMHVRTFFAELTPFPPAIMAEAAALSVGPTCMGKTELHINETLYRLGELERLKHDGPDLAIRSVPTAE